MSTPTGIDVSHHQGTIDWAQVATSGHAFAVVRATRYDGAMGPDRRFRQNWAGAKRAGLLRSAYHYAVPGMSPAAAQAQLLAGATGPLGPGDLPLVLDLEETRLGPAATAAWAVEFLRTLDELTGRRSILYTSPGWAATHLAGPARRELGRWPLWIAHYTSATRPRAIPDLATPLWWQHTSTGRCPGIAGDVDLNRSYVDHAELRRLAHLTPTTDPEELDMDEKTLRRIISEELDERLDPDGKGNLLVRLRDSAAKTEARVEDLVTGDRPGTKGGR